MYCRNNPISESSKELYGKSKGVIKEISGFQETLVVYVLPAYTSLENY